ncbi:MAG: hypothetical protein ACU0GG_21630 [Paracoccaceae bacterium]
MVDIVKLGYEVRTDQVLKADKALDKLTTQTINADRASGSLNATMARLGRGPLRNLSLQLSQVAQSASATGDPIRALAIQLPDIGLAFGTIGIAAGVAAGALLPMVANLNQTSDAARTFSQTVANIDGELNDIRSTLNLLTELQGSYAAAVLRGQDQIANSLKEEIELRGQLLSFNRLQAQQQLNALEESLEGSKAALDEVIQAAQNAAVAIERDLVNEQFTRTQAQQSALAAVRRVLDENRNVTLEYQKQQAEADLLRNQIGQIDRLLDDAAGGASNLAAGLGQAAEQAANAAISLQQVMDRQNKVYSGRGGDPRQPVSTLGEDGLNALITPTARRRSGGGGGGSRVDPFQGNLTSLVQSLETERETVDRYYHENLAILEDRRAMEVLGKENHLETLRRLEEQYLQDIRGIQANANTTQLNEYASFFGAMASVAAQGGSDVAKAAATFGGIQATINSYVAATQALADPSIGFWGKAAAYTSTLATGLGAVKAIGQAGSSVGVGGSAASGVSAAQPSTQINETISIEVIGDGLEAELFERFAEMLTSRNRQGRNFEVIRR